MEKIVAVLVGRRWSLLAQEIALIEVCSLAGDELADLAILVIVYLDSVGERLDVTSLTLCTWSANEDTIMAPFKPHTRRGHPPMGCAEE